MSNQNSTIGLIVFYLATCIGLSAEQPTDILQHYRAMPRTQLGEKFSINKGPEGWFSNSSMGYEFPITVDFRNGYIGISDGGTGGGRYSHMVALYLGNSGTQYLLVAEHLGDPICTESAVRFYEFADGKYEDRTGVLFPVLSIGSFYSDRENSKMLIPGIEECGPHLSYWVPQHGTQVEVSIQFGLPDEFPSIEGRKILLSWDAENETFRLRRLLP